MLESLLMHVIYEMSEDISYEQLTKLKNVLFMTFHNKEIIDKESISSSIEHEVDNNLKLIEMFKASKLISGRQKNTIEQYERELKSVIKVLNKRFEDITTSDLRFYFGVLKENNKVCMNTLKTRKRYLNSFWVFLQQEGIVKENPVARIEPFRVEHTIKKPFSEKELESLKMVANSSLRDRALLEFLCTTGVRVSELCSINVGDIDFYKKEFIVMGKGKKERTLYISEAESYHLERYLEERKKKENKTLEELKNTPLFVSNKKPYNRLTIAGVQYLLKELGKKADVEDVHPHRFRRTFATNLLNKDMKIEEVRELMGHTKVDTTLIYCDIKQSVLKESYKKYAA